MTIATKYPKEPKIDGGFPQKNIAFMVGALLVPRETIKIWAYLYPGTWNPNHPRMFWFGREAVADDLLVSTNITSSPWGSHFNHG